MRTISDTEKKQIAIAIVEDLVHTHGKQLSYSQKQIRTSLDKRKFDVDIHCWAYCLYMDHGGFDTYHQSIGESCDYGEMKSSMVSAATEHASDSWFDFDFDLSWMEFPDFDFLDLFDFIDL